MARTISNDITNLAFTTPRTVQDITGVDKSAFERLQLLADFTVTLNGVFNSAANQSHDVFKTVPSTSVNRAVSLTVASGSNVMAVNAIFNDYALTRANNGALTWVATGDLADGAVPTWA